MTKNCEIICLHGIPYEVELSGSKGAIARTVGMLNKCCCFVCHNHNCKEPREGKIKCHNECEYYFKSKPCEKIKDVKVLLKRDVELKSLTENEFVDFVKEDYEKAVQIFNELPGFQRKTNYDFIDIEIDYNYDARPCDRVIHFNSDKIDTELRRAFKSIQNSKNFEYGIGWELRAEIWKSSQDNLKFSTSLYILYPEKIQKELLRKRAEEGEEIQKFYNDLEYKGD